MKKLLILLLLIAAPISKSNIAYSSDDHPHNAEEYKDKHENESGHNDEEPHEEDNHDEEHDDHGEESSKFGKNKAILEVKNDGKQFRLAPRAEKIMEIKISKLLQKNHEIFQIPLPALVEFGDEQGIYIQHRGWYQLIEIKILKTEKNSLLIEAHDLQQEDKIVTSGVSLLRIAHLEASGQGGQGHGH